MNTQSTPIVTISQAYVSQIQQAQQHQQTAEQEQFSAFCSAFKTLARNKNIAGYDILIYNLVRGLQPTRGFTKITNYNKLHNGMIENNGFQDALAGASYKLGEPNYLKKYTGSLINEEGKQTNLCKQIHKEVLKIRGF